MTNSKLDEYGFESDQFSRRVFVTRISLGGTGIVLVGGCKKEPPISASAAAPVNKALAQPQTSSHQTFTNDEWATLSSAVDRIVPNDGDPGALDANVPEYIDRILQPEQLAQMRENFVPGLAALDRRSTRMFNAPFAAVKPNQQDEILTLFKNSPEKSGEYRWYEMLVVLTLEGFLGDPSYGGNKGEVGWKLIGFSLVGRNVKGDPSPGYDGQKALHTLRCGGGKGC